MFLRIFKHLLPRAKAWSITIDKKLRQFFDGLTVIGDDIKTFVDEVYLDLFPKTTRELDKWENQFNLPNPLNLTEQERRDRLDAAWKALGGQSPKYIQDTLRNSGFDVYVHEWWDPNNEPPVNDNTCITPRNPFYVLKDINGGHTMGDPVITMGSGATMGGDAVLKGYLLVNAEDDISIDMPYTMGNPVVTMGGGATMGFIDGFTLTRREFDIPADVKCWHYILYIGGQNFGDVAQIPQDRRLEFEQLCLKICPTQQWLGMIVEYV